MLVIMAGVESDAEHTFSMIILALEIMSKEKLKLNQEKVLKLIAYHELCEIDYGDHTPFDNISKEEKFENELKCIKRISKECDMPEILDYWIEFEKGESTEAIFAKKIDRLDAVMQSRIYSDLKHDDSLFEEFSSNSHGVYEEYKKYVESRDKNNIA